MKTELSAPGLRIVLGIRIAFVVSQASVDARVHLQAGKLSDASVQRIAVAADEIAGDQGDVRTSLIGHGNGLSQLSFAQERAQMDVGQLHQAEAMQGFREVWENNLLFTQVEVKALDKHAVTEGRHGGATINLIGVDYQRFNRPYLTGAESLMDPAAFNVLLSHNPDVFPVAARKGFPLTISGHTHGGQVRVEILEHDLNVARFYTPYVDGLYRRGDSSVFVSRGIGTIGLPARLGSPPEVALITLCRT